jgi:hypothetical protein
MLTGTAQISNIGDKTPLKQFIIEVLALKGFPFKE